VAAGPVLTPFVVAAVLAYALTPLVDWLDDVGVVAFPACWRCGGGVAVHHCHAGILLLMVPILAKELPLLREQVPVLIDSLNTMLQTLVGAMGHSAVAGCGASRPSCMKYLNANFEDAFGSLMASLKIGGSVALSLWAMPC
jgi:predicted PurR-regulated permease PerM